MKIIGGKFKNRNFYMPATIRPTQNMLRKALFDLIGQDLEGLTFLDLFAGSGAMGLEALSRGAKKVTFVEKLPDSLKVIEENIVLLNTDLNALSLSECQVLEADGFAAVKEFSDEGQTFDIVFADPPYERGMAKKILKTLEAHDIVHSNSIIAIQHDRRESLPEADGRFSLFRERMYGNSLLTIYKVA